MATQLTLKQREFVKEYVSNGGNGTQAALVAYDTDDANTADSIASENLQKPAIASAMQQALAKLELTENNIAVVVRDAMSATKQHAIGTNQEDQAPIVIETPDHRIRLKAAEFTAKLMDAMPMKRSLDGAKKIRDLHQHVHLASEPIEVLEWQAQHGRKPSSKERALIVGAVKNPADNTVTDGENVPDKAAKRSKHKDKRDESS